MDYIKQSLPFKLKKVFRYTQLYGPRRTLIKVKGQYHTKKKYELLPNNDINKNHKNNQKNIL